MSSSSSSSPAAYVELETSLGAITLELYTRHAPKACENFLLLSRRGYYNGVPVHRLIPGFLIQGGDPTGTGRGGASAWGAPFADEVGAGLAHTGAGVLSMANAGPGTNGSQFFITLAPTPHLDGKHTIFGRVAAGMAVLERLARVPTGPDDRPRDKLVIVRASVVPAPAAA